MAYKFITLAALIAVVGLQAVLTVRPAMHRPQASSSTAVVATDADTEGER